MPTAKDRAERRERHALEVETSQDELRKSIAVTERLVEQSDQMLRRHRSECEQADAEDQTPLKDAATPVPQRAAE